MPLFVVCDFYDVKFVFFRIFGGEFNWPEILKRLAGIPVILPCSPGAHNDFYTSSKPKEEMGWKETFLVGKPVWWKKILVSPRTMGFSWTEVVNHPRTRLISASQSLYCFSRKGKGKIDTFQVPALVLPTLDRQSWHLIS